MLTWLSFYLVRERHPSMQSMARTASIYYLVDAVSAIATGLLSDVWIRKGYTPTLVRKTVMAIGYTIACVAMAGFAASPQIYLPWLMAAGGGFGVAGSGIFAFTQTLAGPQAAGRSARLPNGFANFVGACATALTGFLVGRAHRS